MKRVFIGFMLVVVSACAEAQNETSVMSAYDPHVLFSPLFIFVHLFSDLRLTGSALFVNCNFIKISVCHLTHNPINFTRIFI